MSVSTSQVLRGLAPCLTDDAGQLGATFISRISTAAIFLLLNHTHRLIRKYMCIDVSSLAVLEHHLLYFF